MELCNEASLNLRLIINRRNAKTSRKEVDGNFLNKVCLVLKPAKISNFISARSYIFTQHPVRISGFKTDSMSICSNIVEKRDFNFVVV